MSIRMQDALLYAGGECLQRFGVPAIRMTRSQDVAATFTRSGTVGSFVDKDRTLRAASANQLRVHWVDADGDGVLDTPAFLLEAARTNLISDDDLTNWGTQGTPVVTGSVSDPAGGTGAYTVEDDNASGDEYVTSPTIAGGSFSGDGSKAVVFVIRENTHPGGSDVQVLALRDTTVGAYRLELWITSFTDGEPAITANTGEVLEKLELGNGYWAIFAQSTTCTAANAHQAWVTPTSSSDDVGSIDVYRVNLYDATLPLHSIVSASEVKNADTLYFDFLHPPQAMTIYLKFVECGTVFTTAGGLFQVGASSSGTSPYLAVGASGASDYRGRHHNGSSEVLVTLTDQPSYFDLVELRVTLAADGSITIGQSLNGGAEDTDTSAANALASAWADTRFYLGSRSSSAAAQYGINAFLALKVVAGDRSLADMAALFAYDSARAVL